ncbi:hypothetical protein F0562_024592 [Nyssa sinensis]|uniref:Uncharacterized protein n=1 Tax=Nyssa sinensis TaxID=561372 RepID=A0A5J5BCQ7_9ASTE|nr:hypothetical protein F0562_024592 [Nyssa sinensis]
MFNMDFRGKDISWVAWVGNICQKFEALCSELDDIMCEETIKYVENQLQTLGADVKQFCAEFVHDVLPPFSVDSMKEATTDLSLDHTKGIDLVAHERSKIGVHYLPYVI